MDYIGIENISPYEITYEFIDGKNVLTIRKRM